MNMMLLHRSGCGRTLNFGRDARVCAGRFHILGRPGIELLLLLVHLLQHGLLLLLLFVLLFLFLLLDALLLEETLPERFVGADGRWGVVGWKERNTTPNSNHLSYETTNIIMVRVLMRDEEGRKKEASKVKQTRQSNTAHPRQSLFRRKIRCLGWDSSTFTQQCKRC